MSLNTGLKYQGGVPINAERLNTSSLNRIRDKSCVLALDFNNDTSDRSSYGNHGTNSGAVFVGGKHGLALSFNGTSSYVQVADSNSLDVTIGLTISAKIYSDVYETNYGFICCKSPDDTYWMMYLSGTTRKPAFIVAVGKSITSDTALTNGQWYHVTGTFDSSLPTQNIKLFINGISAASPVNYTTPLFVQTYPLNIGYGYSGLYFNGIIDDLYIYNRALNQAEIYSLYRGLD